MYSYGHRNVQGLAFDDEGRLWASELGDQTWDELNLITKGGNYGWPQVEGSSRNKDLINPKVVVETADASPSGLAYWRGKLWMPAPRTAAVGDSPGHDAGPPVGHFADRYGPPPIGDRDPRREQSAAQPPTPTDAVAKSPAMIGC